MTNVSNSNMSKVRIKMLPMWLFICLVGLTFYLAVSWMTKHGDGGGSTRIQREDLELMVRQEKARRTYVELMREEQSNVSKIIPETFITDYDEDTVLFGKSFLGYNSTRIPALVYLNGIFFAFCEARNDTESDWGNMDIMLRRGRRSGNKILWERPQIVASIPGFRVMNPTPIVDRERNTIVLVFISISPWLTEHEILIAGTYNQTLQMTMSTDNGKSWAKPMDITQSTLGAIEPTPAMFASGPGHGIQLRSGRLIVPGNVFIKDERGHENQHGCLDYSMVFYSDDGGQSWHPGGRVLLKKDYHNDYILTNEVQAVEIEENQICLNSRTLSPFQTRAISCSDNGGMNFSEPHLTENLIEPGFKILNGSILRSNFSGCQASMISFPAPRGVPLDDDHHSVWVLFSNPADLGQRKDISIRVSTDSLKSWSAPWTIHTYAGAYSDLTYLGRDRSEINAVPQFAILYERGFREAYHEIAFKTFTLDDIV